MNNLLHLIFLLSRLKFALPSGNKFADSGVIGQCSFVCV